MKDSYFGVFVDGCMWRCGILGYVGVGVVDWLCGMEYRWWDIPLISGVCLFALRNQIEHEVDSEDRMMLKDTFSWHISFSSSDFLVLA